MAIIGLKSLRRPWVWGGLLTLTLAVLCAHLLAAASPTAAQIVAAEVKIGNVEQTILAIGKVQPRDLVNVGAQVTGRINRLHVALGDRVRQGQLIAEVDAEPQRSALRSAEAAVAALTAQSRSRRVALEQAQLMLERQRVLASRGFISRTDFENAQANAKIIRADIDSLSAQIEQARTQVESARINLSYTRITSPIDGTVVAIVTKQGQTLNAFQSTPTIVAIADMDTMVVRTEVSEADVSKLTPGQVAWFTTLGSPDRRHYTRIERIEPGPTTAATEASGTAAPGGNAAIYYNAMFTVPNPEGMLRPSMTVQVSILLARAEHVLTIPSSALGEQIAPSVYSVQVVDTRGRLKAQTVTVGLNNNDRAEIRKGLRAGERVVLGDASKAPDESAPSLLDMGS